MDRVAVSRAGCQRFADWFRRPELASRRLILGFNCSREGTDLRLLAFKGIVSRNVKDGNATEKQSGDFDENIEKFVHE